MSIWSIWHDKNTENMALESLPIHEIAYRAHEAREFTDVELRPIERITEIKLHKYADKYIEAGRYNISFINDYSAIFLTLSNHISRRYFYRYIGDKRGKEEAYKAFSVPANEAEIIKHMDSKIIGIETFEELSDKEPILYLCNKNWRALPSAANNKYNALILEKAQRLYNDIVTRYL